MGWSSGSLMPLTRATTSRTAVAYSAYSGIRSRLVDWMARKRTDRRRSGSRAQHRLEGQETAQRVLRRFESIDPHDHPRLAGAGQTRLEPGPLRGDVGAGGEGGQRIGIQRDGIRADPDGAALPAHVATVGIDACVGHERLGGEQEVRRVSVGLEAEDVVVKEPFADAPVAVRAGAPGALRPPATGCG